MDDVEIALFPIPQSVCFPFSSVPLNVFEPRYRRMITDCILKRRLVGIAHTKRQISGSKVDPDASVEEYVNSNGPSYEPFPIFSAGQVQLVSTDEVGRLYIYVNIVDRFELGEETQTLPYKIFRCRRYTDDPGPSGEEAREEMQESIMRLPDRMASELKKIASSEEWETLSLYEYSFRIYSLFTVDAETRQKALESKSPIDRIMIMKDKVDRWAWG